MNSQIAKNRMAEVVRVDTITASQADFLATHVPVKKIQLMKKYGENTGKQGELTEDEAYQEYVLNSHNKHQFILVIGSSGAGKSHLIRWFGARLEQSLPENEVVLFVKRSDNSLKGTIKQLLEKPEVANIPNKNVYDRLVRATSTIDDKKLKDMIYQNFIVEIKNDDNNEMLNNVARKRLIALLQNPVFQERLMEDQKAIDRIYSKVAENTQSDNRDVLALFNQNDFSVDNDLWDEMEGNGADKNAMKMITTLMNEDDYPEKLAEYMNTLVDPVIQTCAGLEPGDFEQVFIEIRKELKRQGKNLTLLIEDITAFTGVNVALLNVLTTEETGMYTEDNLCRISSIVGTTTGYYEKNFMDNHKDRVSNFLFIPDDVFGSNPNDLYEFVGRYLNVMSLEKEIVEEWAKSGNLEENYPIHEIREGMEWDYTILSSGKKLNLYPFSKNAVLNLYHCMLQPHQRTPRYLLREVIEKTVSDMLYNKEHFPGFKIDNMPMFSPHEHRLYLSDRVTNEEYERLSKFICVWGDANLYEYTDDRGIILGGIPKTIYKELGFSKVDGINNDQKSEPDVRTEPVRVKPTVPDEKPISVVPETRRPEPEKIIPLKQPEVPKPQAPENTPEMKEFQAGIQSLDDWMNGGELNVGGSKKDVIALTKARDELNKYLYTAINWQVEGISMDSIFKIKELSKFKLVGVERQKRGQDEALVKLPATRETQEILEAFLGYVTLGNGSWNYEGAAIMVYKIQIWTERIKNKIIEAISMIGEERSRYSQYAIVSEIYRQIFFGLYQEQDIDNISVHTLLNDQKSVINANNHSKEWNSVMSLIVRDENDVINKDTMLQYYNLIQGSQKASQVFLDYDRFNKDLKSIIEDKKAFLIDKIQLNDQIKKRREVGEYLSSILSRMEKVCVEETKIATTALEKLEHYFDDIEDLDEDEIVDFCDKVKSFYDEINNGQFNIVHQNEMIQVVKDNAIMIENSIESIVDIDERTNNVEKLLVFSNDPMKSNSMLLDLLNKVEQDVQKVNETLNKRRDKIGIISEEASVIIRYKKQLELISNNKLILQGMEEDQ